MKLEILVRGRLPRFGALAGAATPDEQNSEYAGQNR